MIKICSPQLGMSPNSRLGGEVYDYQTIRGFAKKGISVYVLLPKGKYFDKTLTNLHVKYAFFKHIAPPIMFSLISLPYLINTYQREKFDILRIHSPRFLGLAGFIFHLLYPKVPILTSAVTVDRSDIYYPLEKLTFNVANKIIVQSQYMRLRLIKKYNVNTSKIVVTYGGQFDDYKISPIKPLLAKFLLENDKVLLFMGALIERKNPIFAAKVFVECRKTNPNLKLIIIGSGKLKGKLIKFLRDQGVNQDVLMIDSAYEKEKAYWFSRMDIFLCPSLDEGFGLVVTEAMSFSKPVIASDRAAFEEIIDNGVSGYTIKLSNFRKWVATANDLLKNHKLTQSVSIEASRRVNKQFNWERTYELNFQVIKKMIGGK